MLGFHFIYTPDFARVTGLLTGTPGAGLRVVEEPALVAEAAAAHGEVSVYDDDRAA